MAVKEARRDQADAIQETAAEVMASTKQRLDEVTSAQRDFFAETSRHWLNRMQAESNLASEFTAKLTAARSVPDVMSAYQEWASRRTAMMLEDAQRFWEDARKFMQTGTKGLGVGS
jgi:hypothetical protein